MAYGHKGGHSQGAIRGIGVAHSGRKRAVMYDSGDGREFVGERLHIVPTRPCPRP